VGNPSTKLKNVERSEKQMVDNYIGDMA